MNARESLLRRIVPALALALLLTPVPGSAQHFQWPEKPKNLKVLKDVKGEELRAVMMSFTHGLGARCDFCHVAKEGAPMSEWDFAADDKPEKQTARDMLELVQSIRGQLEKMSLPKDEPKVDVTCFTCHHGRNMPRELSAELMLTYKEQGADSMAVRYHTLKDRYLARGAYDFGEGTLAMMAHEMMSGGDSKGALKALQLNVEAYPQSARSLDSLAEAYLAAGQRDDATATYKKALEVDPKDEEAMIKAKDLDAPLPDGPPRGRH